MDTKTVTTATPDELFETDRLDLAALLLARGLTFVSARSDGNWKHFQFLELEKCEEIKKDYDFGSPTVKLHEYEAAKRRLNRIVHA